MLFSLQQLHSAMSDATSIGDANICGLTTDSRKVNAGDLFVALRGEQYDAHDFLHQVAAAGAAAVIAEHVPEGYKLPAILVRDTKLALIEVGRYWRQHFDLPVIGVTGSNGKTTVKEMISSILAAAYGEEQRLATVGNLNNEIGVPLTMMRLRETHRAAVIEMGMNHPGEIALLARAAMPTVALVNNAQREHQEFMHSIEAVAQENGAVLLALPDDGVAVFPAGDAYTELWRSYAMRTGQRKIQTFGISEDADVKGTFLATPFGSALEIDFSGSKLKIQLNAAGQHNVLNALAAAACCQSIGISHDAIRRGLENFRPVNGRLQRKLAANGVTVIDDTYNANPDSVRAAIDVLAQLSGHRTLILGDMGEVGDSGEEFHREIGEYARSQGIEQLLLLGELVRHTAIGFGVSAQYFHDIDSLFLALDSGTKSQSTVLVKGSRFMRMERVVAHLLASGNTTLQQ